MVKITSVIKGSRAEKAGILPLDTLVAVNNNEICDVLDYRFYLTEKNVRLLLRREGNEYTADIKKGEYDDIGLEFETPLMDKKHTCKNGCIFCFIDQNPEGLRDTLYFKDDDSRLSFLHGNYITLTNMTDKDVERIVKMRFSPINISIHTTNPELRVKMMKNKRSGEVLKYLKVFKDAGLSMCGQIVLCKGVNDGDELMRSLYGLSEYFPELSSVSVVPAGLTKYRDKLYPLTDFTRDEAAAVIDMIDSVAEPHKKKFGSRLFFAADELYLKAEREIPCADYYEEYPQIENGVGMIRSILDEFNISLDDAADYAEQLKTKRRVAIATGVASYETVKSMADRLSMLSANLEIKVYRIINKFFGESITVSGLLTGRDILEALRGELECDELLIPQNSLRCGEDVFLCGMTVAELAEALGVKVTPTANDGFEFTDAVFGMATV